MTLDHQLAVDIDDVSAVGKEDPAEPFALKKLEYGASQAGVAVVDVAAENS